MCKNTPMITRWVYEAKGALANETLYPAKKAKVDGYIPFKSSDVKIQDVTKYGGFNSVSGAYFFLVEHDDKKGRIRTIETVPIYLKNKIENTKGGLLNYCVDGLHLKNPRICYSKIRMQSLMSVNGMRVRISSRADSQIQFRNEVSLCLGSDWNNYIHTLEKFSGDNSKNVTKEENIALYDCLMDKHLNGIYKNRINPVGEKIKCGRDKFISLDLSKQVFVLLQILGLSSIGLPSADLSLMCGTMKINKKISGLNEFSIINQSITGIYETKIDLLKV